jgi:23S rRNA pseudouridine1911/1915/1917 synthase
MAVLPAGGRVAITNYTTEQTFRAAADKVTSKGKGNNSLLLSVVRCSLETGRTHQVRVHMAHLGTPIVGDGLYGAGFRTKALTLPKEAAELFLGMERQALHATSLRFKHPITGRIQKFETILPEDIAELCNALERLDAKLSKN